MAELPRCAAAVVHPGVVDDDVLTRARAGSGEAFTEIYRELAGPVAAYLRAKGMVDAEDLTSEVFVAVFTGLPGFVGDEKGFRSWVFTIAHRRVIDTWRRSGSPPEPGSTSRTTTPGRPRARRSSRSSWWVRSAPWRCWTCSPSAQREVLVLRIVADLTLEEVAAVVGRPLGAVKALQRRGLATLRRILSTEGVSL